MRRLLMIAAPVVVALTVGTAASAQPKSAPCNTAPEPFKAASLIVETNATDGDAGLQVFLDHEPWKAVAIYKPDGRKMLDVKTRSVLKSWGLTELFSESSEPPFTELPLEEFKKLFPEGEYRFAGCTIDGQAMMSSVSLTHDFPPDRRSLLRRKTRRCRPTRWWLGGSRPPNRTGSRSPATGFW